MNKLVIILALASLVACGSKTEQVVVQGQPGQNGRDGNNGSDGYSIVAKTNSNPALCGSAGGTEVILALDLDRSLNVSENDTVQTQFVTCNGKNGLDGQDGADGQDGQNGTNGKDGLDGKSCTVNKVGSVATITCGSSTVSVSDGAQGVKGDKGDKGDTGSMPSGIFIKEIVKPCGDEFPNDEIFLRLSTNQLLALYDGGPNDDRLVMLAPGNYRTTDRNQNNACYFTVTSDYQITNEHFKHEGDE